MRSSVLKPEFPTNETERLQAVHALRILDTAPEERFDRLTRMARRMFGVAISMVSIVDCNRQWFKSAQGIELSETPRDISFCGHAILGNGMLIIPDATKDPRFADNPLVTAPPHIRFYAGCPLRVADGFNVGTLCIIDDKPKQLTAEDKELFQDLALMAEQEISALQLATLDLLTGIANRRGFITLAQHQMTVQQAQMTPMTLVLFDLDDLKPINDAFGHVEGDEALITFAKVLHQVLPDEVIGRIGGDEFVAFIADDGGKIEQLISQLQTALQQVKDAQNKSYLIRFSAGFVSQTQNPMSVEEMIEVADAKMYEHKNSKDRKHFLA